MSLFNRFIESIIPAPDRDDDDLLSGGGQHSPRGRSARPTDYGRENEDTVGNGLGYGKKSGKAKANDHDNEQSGARSG